MKYIYSGFQPRKSRPGSLLTASPSGADCPSGALAAPSSAQRAVDTEDFAVESLPGESLPSSRPLGDLVTRKTQHLPGPSARAARCRLKPDNGEMLGGLSQGPHLCCSPGKTGGLCPRPLPGLGRMPAQRTPRKVRKGPGFPTGQDSRARGARPLCPAWPGPSAQLTGIARTLT